MDTNELDELTKQAKRTLIGSWLGEYTRHNDMYPHQWGWDTPFLSLGWATFAPEKARKELRSQFEHQWPNGMVPQIIFHAGEALRYFPGPDRWQAQRYSGQDGSPTSGCIQPPTQATGALSAYQYSESGKGKEFLAWLYPRLLQWHRYLYRERCPDDDGLVYVRHPWETGLDNLPDWDAPLERIDLDDRAVPPYRRQDNLHVTDEHRPPQDYYDRYTALVDLFRLNNYDEHKIRQECEFLVEDPIFNAILVRSNQALVTMAEMLDRSTDEPMRWLEQTRSGMREKLYSDDGSRFYAYDRRADELLDEHDSIVGYAPLYGDVPTDEQAEAMVERMDERSYFDEDLFAIPTTSPDDPEYNPANYWRGPVWPFTNWMMIHGLRDYDMHERAQRVETDWYELIAEHGFCENHSPETGEPVGATTFPDTAALFLERMYYENRI